MNGYKLLKIKVRRYSFIDFLKNFNVSLAKLPKLFSLNHNCKGHQPHRFNTPENLNYLSHMPHIKYSWSDNLKNDGREKLSELHTQEVNKNTSFDNRNELLKYCIDEGYL